VTSENPWETTTHENVSTLEWNLPSPPSYHTFEEIPSVKADLLIHKS
jgi:heme/copper-type cytochrome/quinol oxidase subunit 1